ncbi:MAG: hypothetical protein GX316_03850 [Firmicutes bacterium]|nr:hypothetical protein [Bacillota bacterium]
MLCEECRKRPATVHITKIVNNAKTEMHLCQHCAQAKGELGVISPGAFTFQEFLTGMLQQVAAPSPSVGQTALPADCPNCGRTFNQIREKGQLGCSVCYDHFKDQIQPLLRRIQGTTSHAGKLPGVEGAALEQRRQIDALRDKQRAAISQEKYEEAAKLRDEIRGLEKRLKESKRQNQG